jgi:hypothetical protein
VDGAVVIASVAVRRPAIVLVAFAAWSAPPAVARGQGAQPAPAPELSPEARVEIATTPPEGKTAEETVAGPDQPPPTRPRHKGLVLESTLGVLGFAGQFRHVAPPAYWLHGQLGYELLRWLMLFGEGEVAFTDTSESEDESHTRAFPLWGFGAGARATIHASDRVAVFGQGQVGALTAYVPHNTLTVLGYRKAESLQLALGGRLGVEWYQADRHLALCVQIGARDAQGFAKLGSSDVPLMWDGAAGLRYTF